MPKFIGIDECQNISGPAVVIDVLRAFTVAPLAISRGAREVVLVESLDEALRLKASTPSSLAFKDGPPQQGFDLFNSPAHLLNLDVEGRTIFQRTTAGTRAAMASAHCKPLFCSSFVCASATARHIRALGLEPTYVISGDSGNATEDRAAALFIDALVSNPEADSAPFVRAVRESKAADDLRRGIELGYVGVDASDIEICVDVDLLDFCLVASKGELGMTLRQFMPQAG